MFLTTTAISGHICGCYRYHPDATTDQETLCSCKSPSKFTPAFLAVCNGHHMVLNEENAKLLSRGMKVFAKCHKCGMMFGFAGSSSGYIGNCDLLALKALLNT